VGEVYFLRKPLIFLSEPNSCYEIGITDVDRQLVDKFIWREWAHACPLKAVLRFCLGSLDPYDYSSGSDKQVDGCEETDHNITLRLWERGYIKPDERVRVGVLEDCYHFRITPAGKRVLEVLEHMHNQPPGKYLPFLYGEWKWPKLLEEAGFGAHLKVPKRV
jgi:hypothetical protein